MRKNGFIATSILYSFFLVFITLFIALVMNYLRNQVLLDNLDEEARKKLAMINNTKISDLQVGDYIKFKNASTNKTEQFLNDDASWVVAYIDTTVANQKKYYFLSNLDAHLLKVYFYTQSDLNHPSADTRIPEHNTSVGIYTELKAGNYYANSLMYPNFNFSVPTASMLMKIREQEIDEDIKNAIFNVGGDYVVYIDTNTIPGYESYKGLYFDMRTYSFPVELLDLDSSEDDIQNFVNYYCGGTFDGENASYGTDYTENPFGYISVVRESVKNKRYVNYCSFASPIYYKHNRSDNIVIYDEEALNDAISDTYSSAYTIRLMADVTVYPESEDSVLNPYVAGGKGTSIDPYILTDGVKVS